MTASDLRDLFLTSLTRRFGGSRRWRIVIGDVKLYPRDTHPHCNWTLSPMGGAGEVEAVEQVADDLRAAHPIVTAG